MKPKRKRSYMIMNGKVYCFRDPDDLCIVTNFLTVTSTTDFHDAELAQCTKEINSLLRL